MRVVSTRSPSCSPDVDEHRVTVTRNARRISQSGPFESRFAELRQAGGAVVEIPSQLRQYRLSERRRQLAPRGLSGAPAPAPPSPPAPRCGWSRKAASPAVPRDAAGSLGTRRAWDRRACRRTPPWPEGGRRLGDDQGSSGSAVVHLPDDHMRDVVQGDSAGREVSTFSADDDIQMLSGFARIASSSISCSSARGTLGGRRKRLSGSPMAS